MNTIRTLLIAGALAAPAYSQGVTQEWTRVGPPGTLTWIDLKSRNWIAFGPQVVIKARTVLSVLGSSGTKQLDRTALVNCAEGTLAWLDTRGFSPDGKPTFQQSEKGIPQPVGQSSLNANLVRSACAPPPIITIAK